MPKSSTSRRSVHFEDQAQKNDGSSKVKRPPTPRPKRVRNESSSDEEPHYAAPPPPSSRTAGKKRTAKPNSRGSDSSSSGSGRGKRGARRNAPSKPSRGATALKHGGLKSSLTENGRKTAAKEVGRKSAQKEVGRKSAIKEDGRSSPKERKRRSELARSLPRGPDGKFISRYAASHLSTSDRSPTPKSKRSITPQQEETSDGSFLDTTLPPLPQGKFVKEFFQTPEGKKALQKVLSDSIEKCLTSALKNRGGAKKLDFDQQDSNASGSSSDGSDHEYMEEGEPEGRTPSRRR